MESSPAHSWNLYWVASDGFEDCFVVAKNARSARSIECQMNGFDFAEVKATKITSIPDHVIRSYQRARGYRKHPWPGYVYSKNFFKKMGAEFRTINGKEEMLLDEVVYEVDEYAPCAIYRRRTIGFKAIEEFKNIPELVHEIDNYDDEDIWREPEIHLVTALGMCLIRCQQIEHYIAQSFLFGISRNQKRKYETINDLRAGWRKKTLGNMLESIQEAWEIEPTVKANLELFLKNRNLLVHGITTDERFDIRTLWGQRELLSFLNFFDFHSRIVKRAFRASYYASLDFAIRRWGLPKGGSRSPFNKKQIQEISIFVEFFKPKDDAI